MEQLEVHKEIEKAREEINKVEKNILQTHAQLKEAEKILVCLISYQKREFAKKSKQKMNMASLCK